MNITQELLKQSVSYDPETGLFTWVISNGARAKVGEPAGWINAKGHRCIRVCGVETTTPRLIWLYVHGYIPKVSIEHINGDKSDCRLENLRLSTERIIGPLTAEIVRDILDYDPNDGSFRWRKRIAKKVQIGSLTGTKNWNGYILIMISGRWYRAHRLAWLYMTGAWPKMHIDHINGSTGDNRFANLREAEVFQNMANSRKPITNKSGYKGVSWHADAGKWQVHIRFRGKNMSLGLFDDAKDGHDVYCKKAFELRGEFTRTE